MISEIKLGIDSIKATLDLVKAVKGVTEKAELDSLLFGIREHLASLQERLLNAQQVTDLILEERRQAIRELEDECNKNSRLERYALVEPRLGIFLHTYQPSEGDEAPLHYACPKCFSEKTISILQQPDPAKHKIDCQSCSFTYDPRTIEELMKIKQERLANISRTRQANRARYLG